MSDRELKIVKAFIDKIITNKDEREELKDTLALLWDCEVVEGRTSQLLNNRRLYEGGEVEEYRIDVEC